MMPKPNPNRRNENRQPNGFQGMASEKVLLETKPSFWLYSNNFLLKIVVLFILVFMFAPIMTLVYTMHGELVKNFHIAIDNVMFYTELILIILTLVVIIKIILDILDWNYTNYIFTDSRIIIQRGFIHKEKIMMSYNKIQDIEIRQSLLERIIGVGDIIIYGANEMSETVLYDIPSARNAEEIIITQMNNIGFGNQNTYNYQQQANYQQPYPQQPNYNQQYQQQENYNPQYPQNTDYIEVDHNQNNYQQNYPDEDYIEVDHNQNNNEHYFNNDDEVITPEKPMRERWDNNRHKKSTQKQDKKQILRKHDEMFKRHNK